jgi:alpha-glucoside transport system substrate-binding protein
MALNEYLSAVYEINAEFGVGQAAISAASGGNPDDLAAAMVDQLRALRTLLPPPEAVGVQTSQEQLFTRLAAATQRFAAALRDGGSDVLEALDTYLAESEEIALSSAAGDAVMRELVSTTLEETPTPTASYLAAVVATQADTQEVQEATFRLLSDIAADPLGVAEPLSTLVDEFDSLHEQWSGLNPSTEAATMHQRQLDVLGSTAAAFRTLVSILEDGTQPSPATAAELSRVGADASRLAADWGFFFADALAGNLRPLSGTHVSITGGGTRDEDVASIRRALEPFSEETGSRTFYTGVESMRARIDTLLGNGAPPDIGIFFDPRQLATYAGRDLNALPNALVTRVEDAWPEGWLDMAAVDGTPYGVPTSSLLKSLVWYLPASFSEAGYEIPDTWDDLIALSTLMIEAGRTPWCVGIESGSNSGWPFTDWVEDVLLRREPVDVYDDWVAHEVPFNDSRIAGAWNEVLEIWGTEGAVYAEGRTIEQSSWNASVSLSAGRCMMFRQASFLMNVLPDGTRYGPTGIDAFYLPGPTTDDRPALVSGSFGASFRDAAEVWAALEYLASATYAQERQQAMSVLSGRPNAFLSANVEQNLSNYSVIEQTIVQTMQNATVSRFDGADRMPPGIGSSFGAGAVDVVSGTSQVSEVLDGIEASWLAVEAAFFDVNANLAACTEGNELACDLVFLLAPGGSQAANTGFDCAGRRVNNDTACSGYDGNPSIDGPGDDALLDALWELCTNGNLPACQALRRISPVGSEYETLADERRFGF